jgi:hypothetical protein
MRWRRSTHFTVRNSVFVGYMKGGLSLESDETANWYKNGLVTFVNNKVQAFNPTLNFISKSSVITSTDVKTKALNEGNTETNYTTTEIETLSKPVWVNSWTRFPIKGN